MRFVCDLVQLLDEECTYDAFDWHLIVAPPVVLGDLRQVMTGPLKAHLIAEINKDLN